MLPVSYRRSVILSASHQNLTSSPSSARKLTWNPVPHRLLHRRQHQALVRLQRRLPVHTRFRLSGPAACREILALIRTRRRWTAALRVRTPKVAPSVISLSTARVAFPSPARNRLRLPLLVARVRLPSLPGLL